MGSFEFLEHTADIKVRAKGKNFADALESALKAVSTLIAESQAKKPLSDKEETMLIEVKEKFIQDIVVNSMEKLIVLCEINKLIPSDVKVLSFEEGNYYYLKAAVFGKKTEEIETFIKAVTYHQLNIKKDEKETVIEVILDI
jgi:SHS2 domain-containing protein